MRVAVVGHVEWCEFLRVDAVPAAGAIVHAERAWEEPGGGGAVAAVQLARLAGGATLFTALGDDDAGRRAHAALEALGVRMQCAWRDEPQRRAVVHVDAGAERTITVIGDRLGPSGDDALDWDLLAGADAVYFTAGDASALRRARAARVLTATPRGRETLTEAGIALDALIGSGADPGERYLRGQIDPEPAVVLRTAGAAGGRWETAAGEEGRWSAAPLLAPARDAYGCGDSFAAGVTYALGDGDGLEAATALGARCGAACLTGDGPYAGQLGR